VGSDEGVDDLITNPTSRDSGARLLRSMIATVDEVDSICQAENIDCHVAKAGTLSVAHAPFTAKHMQTAAESYATRGFADDYN